MGKKNKGGIEVLCGLCGEEIIAPKGVRKGRLSEEQEREFIMVVV